MSPVPAETGYVLRELVILAGLSLAVTLLFQRLRIPAVTGFVITGVLIGPGGFGLVRDPATVETLAEIGVVLLLFMVGLEFSVADLRALGTRPIAVGVLQVLLTALAVTLALLPFGAPPAQAIFFGFLISLSSTALLLKLLTDRAELGSPHGRLTLGVLLLQDFALVPLTVITPLLAGWSHGHGAQPPRLEDLLRALYMILATGLVIAAAWRAVPWVIERASRARSREAFLAAVVLIVLGSAYLSQAAGLSLALGAFLAGLILAGSELRSQVAADVLPFRDTLSSVFFISIGMLLDPAAVVRSPGIAVAATIGVVAVKALAAGAAGRLVGLPWNATIPTALALAHVGEFSFVLARGGVAAGLLPHTWEQAFLVAALFSIILAPWFVARGPEWALRLRLGGGGTAADQAGEDAAHGGVPARAGHVVIAGYGLNGHNLARVLRAVRIPHVVLDQAPEKVAACNADGSPALLGDAVQSEILRRAGVPRARALVLALSDPFATRHAAHLARRMNPHLFIIVRTRHVREIDAFYEAGANVVIPEEFESSIEIFTAVLRQFHVPGNIVDAQVELLRREHYSIMRGMKLPGSVIEQLDTILAQGTTETVLMLQHSPAVGRTLAEMKLAVGAAPEEAAAEARGAGASPPVSTGLAEAASTGSGAARTSTMQEGGPSPARGGACRVVAVVRGGDAITQLDREFRLLVGDTLVLTGSHAEIDAAVERLSPALEPPATPEV